MDQNEDEFIDYLTEQLNHQLGTPGSLAANYLGIIANRIRNSDCASTKDVRLADDLDSLKFRIREVLNDMQSLRTHFRNNTLNSDMLQARLKFYFRFSEVMIQEYRNLRQRITKDLAKEHHVIFDDSRRKLEQFKRMLNSAQHNISIEVFNKGSSILELSYKKIAQIAFENACDQHDLKLRFSDICRMIGPINTNHLNDYEKITDLFFNLIENSIKYAPLPSRLQITLTISEASSNEIEKEFPQLEVSPINNKFVLIRYRDNGLGIPNSDREKIFERGYRGSEFRNSNVYGSGFGLFYCRKLLRAEGGDIIASGRKERGDGMMIQFCYPAYRNVSSFWKTVNFLKETCNSS